MLKPCQEVWTQEGKHDTMSWKNNKKHNDLIDQYKKVNVAEKSTYENF